MFSLLFAVNRRSGLLQKRRYHVWTLCYPAHMRLLPGPFGPQSVRKASARSSGEGSVGPVHTYRSTLRSALALGRRLAAPYTGLADELGFGFKGGFLRVFCLGLCLLWTAGCDPGVREVAFFWTLIDGRSCTEAAATRAVIATEGGKEYSGVCSGRAENNYVTVKETKGGTWIHARAETAEGAALYRLDQKLPTDLPERMDLVLSFSGGL